MAQMTSLNSVLESLSSRPFGQAPGDPVAGAAMNRNDEAEYTKCYARNWSNSRERRYITEAISWLRGGQKAEQLAKKTGEDFEMPYKRREAYAGQDPSVTAVEIKPVEAVLQFDNSRFIIPPAKDAKKEPEWIAIPQGVMDLYYGNWERLNSPNARERAQEMEAVKGRRKDYCVRLDARGQNTNEFGFLEFKREIIARENIAIDSDSVFPDNYVEV
jgi:hypothetical protein